MFELPRTMSGQRGRCEKRNRRGCDVTHEFLTNVSSKSSRAEEVLDCKQEKNDSNSVPNFIYISTTDMSSGDEHTNLKGAGSLPLRKRKVDDAFSIISLSTAPTESMSTPGTTNRIFRRDENAGVGGHDGHELGPLRKHQTMGQVENPENRILVEILNQLEGIHDRLARIEDRLDGIERKVDGVERKVDVLLGK